MSIEEILWSSCCFSVDVALYVFTIELDPDRGNSLQFNMLPDVSGDVVALFKHTLVSVAVHCNSNQIKVTLCIFPECFIFFS